MARFVLKKLEIDNFRSIKHQEFELKEGLFVIVGDNKDNPGVTNGAGKTSVISAFFWAITGSSLNGEVLADEVINLKVGKNCKVKCVFEVEGSEVVIQRTRKDATLGNSLYFEIDGQDMSCHKLADTQDRISQYMKIPTELLKSIIIMTSDMKSRFSDLTAQGRIELLESIRDYSLWNRMRDESNKDIKDYNSQISELESAINTTQGSINTYNNLIQELLESYKTIKTQIDSDNSQEEIEKIKIQIADLEKEQNELVLPTVEVDSLETQVEELQSVLTNEVGTAKQAEILQIDQDISVQRTVLSDTIDAIQTEIYAKNTSSAEITSQINKLDFELDTIEKWFTNDTCPTCGRKLDRSDKEVTDKTAHKEELSNQKQSLNNQQENITEQVNTLLSTVDDYKKQLKDLDSQKTSKIAEINTSYATKEEEITSQITTIKGQIKEIRNQKEQIQNQKAIISNKIVTLQSTITVLSNKVTENTNKLEEIQAKGKEYRTKVEDLTQQNQERKDNVNALVEDKEVSTYFYQQLGPKGSLRPWLLSRDINYLNVCIKRYAHKFFENIDLYLTKPTLEDNTIKIIIDCGDGVIKPVSSLSGGERKRVDLCIQLALYDLVQSTATFSINFVCFDEIESALDGAGIRTLIDLIDERKEIIPTILWISNRDEVIECVPQKIKVTKLNGFSEVKYV